jgi:hypothetical protein
VSEHFWFIKSAPELKGGVEHAFFFGDHFSPARHPSQVMASIAIIALNRSCMLFADMASAFG